MSLIGAAALALLAAVATPALAAQVYVTDSPNAAELVDSAMDRLSKDEPAEAARLLQRVLDNSRARLLETDEGRYAEAHYVAARLLLSDADLLATYREMHGATAARQFEQAGSDRDELMRVRQRFPVTEAALEAGLREAGLALAVGQAEAAAVVLRTLEDHPDLSTHRARYDELAASAALLLEDDNAFDHHLGRLRERDAADAVAFLEAFKASLSLPRPRRVHSPLATLPDSPVPDVMDDPLWQVATEGVEDYLVQAFQIEKSRLNAYVEDGRLLNAMFAVVDGVIYLNDGLTVAALDSSSGMELWRQRITNMEANFQRFGSSPSQWLPQGVDINGIAVGGDRVAVISGFNAMVTMFSAARGDGESVLAVLDADSGELQWELTPDDLPGSVDDGFWYGQPIIDRNRLYTTFRRRQRTQFQDGFVVCFDLYSGEMLWQRHIASTALTDRQSTPALTHLTLEDGYLYVDSRLGTAARLAAADGSIEWLTMLPIDERNRSQSIHKPWKAAAPILVEAGLILLDDWGEAIHILDRTTGERIDTIRTRDWGRPHYLAEVDGDVLAIGESLVRFDGATLEEQWRRGIRGDHRGRAAIAGNRAFIPAGEGVQVFRLEDGEDERTLDLPLPATMVAIDGQIVAAGRGTLRSYSSWELAARRMQRRIENSPHDPKPVMAMAWLAFNTNRHDALLDTLDQAIELSQAADAPDAAGGSIFEQIMAMTQSESGSDELRQALFQRVALVADDVGQEVAYRLALGRFHETRAGYAQALEQYQTLLSEPHYRQQLYQHEGGARQAGLEAQRRIQRLVGDHGRGLYQPYEAFAARRLDELAEQGDPDPLIELAEAYPLAEVTPEALRLAARRAADLDRMREALALLRQAGQITDDTEHLGRIYGLRAELFEEAEQPDRARRVLRTLNVVHPDVTPVRSGQPIDIDDWLARLDEQRQVSGIATLNLPLSGETRSIAGRVLQPIAQDPHASRSANWLFRTRGDAEDHIELRSGNALEDVLWRVPIDIDDMELLSMDRTRLWLWMPSIRSLRVLDADDGSLVWEERDLRRMLDDIPLPEIGLGVDEFVGPRERAALNRARVAQGRFQPDEATVAVSDVAVAVADTRGRVVLLDSDRGNVQWQQATRVQQLSHLAIDGRHLVIAGVDAEDVPVVCVYNAEDGELMHVLASPRQQPVRWLSITEDGLLVYAGATQIEAFELTRGQSRWICRLEEELVGQGGTWLGFDRVLARTREGDMVWIDITDGRVTGKLALRGQLQGQVQARNDAGAWYITSTNRLIAADNDGQRLWQDSIEDSVRHIDTALTDDFLVTLGGLIDGRVGVGTHPRRLYLVNRETGALAYEQDIDAPENLINVMAAHGRLLLTGPRLTAILTGSP